VSPGPIETPRGCLRVAVRGVCGGGSSGYASSDTLPPPHRPLSGASAHLRVCAYALMCKSAHVSSGGPSAAVASFVRRTTLLSQSADVLSLILGVRKFVAPEPETCWWLQRCFFIHSFVPGGAQLLLLSSGCKPWEAWPKSQLRAAGIEFLAKYLHESTTRQAMRSK